MRQRINPPPMLMPRQSVDTGYRRTETTDNGLGRELQPSTTNAQQIDVPDRWKNWTQLPAYYTTTIVLGGAADDAQAGSVSLRPEPFVLTRISYATTGDVLAQALGFPFNSGMSIQGRSVRLTWEDEFTKFMAQSPSLVSAVFGDSNGFLDVPATVLFEGRQTLTVNLRRVLWPYDPTVVTPTNTEWDFVFQGVSLLPPGTEVSGSVR